MRLIKVLFLLLLGGGAGVGGLKGYERFFDSTATTMLEEIEGATGTAEPDSIGNDSEVPDTLTLVMDTLPGVRIEPVDSVAAPALLASDSGAAAPGSAPVAGTAGVATAPEERLDPRRLAKLFGSMQAREAARVLERMNDSDIQVVLNQLADRQAAGILSNLSPERAAQLTQVVLRGERNPQ